MKLIFPEEGLITYKDLPRQKYLQQSQKQSGSTALIVEHMMEVYLNEVLTYQLICSPAMLPELVLGRLCSEGIIRNTEDVEMIYLCKEGLRARVFLKQTAKETTTPLVETIPTCCTGNRTLSNLFSSDILPPMLSPIPYQAEWIYRLSSAINRDTPIYAATHSAHSCILMRQGEILVCAEDIGRHNAMDKVIGWGLIHNIPLTECILYTSGRVPVDMTMKAIRAGVPILVSKALPTDQALRLAKEFQLTLIGGAHPDCFQVFTGHEAS